MTQRFQYQAMLALLLSSLAMTTAACQDSTANLLQRSDADSIASSPAAIPSPQTAASPKAIAAADNGDNNYEKAIDRATAAAAITQSAQSKDDWRLVVDRWQQAIQFMGTIPKTNSRYVQVQKKLTEYRRNLAYAQQQTRRSTEPTPSLSGRVTVLSPRSTATPQPSLSSARPIAIPPSTVNQTLSPAENFPAEVRSSSAQPRSFSVPIIRRAGSTPVIQVTFNGNQSFDMIVDTGASGTLITRAMASALRVVPVGQASVDTASERNVSVPLGYVSSISVGGATAQNVLVAVAGPQLSIGLLGHDFFGNYDVTIRQNEVEFRER
ncbi:MAG: retroviral-like aspartic protease family protein [Oscillatoriophycideae cyanobacterium NC_groundwater_1537_Pr4_S-0.65um_50_18]|nr:retroviral-like aspartic protease family protein [Oscillatoriophycideae cyanobacterium NC_groundwater_1537_Pr4_S-0.65um_50_18]